MAPASHGGKALHMIMNFRDEDRLWGPQLHSRLLQSHTIFGFWGKKSDDVRVQPGQPSFLFVMGTGGKLLRCSSSHARLCEAWRELFGQQQGLNLFIEASWNRWRCSWAFCLLSAAASDDDSLGVGTHDGNRVPRAPWRSHFWQAGRAFGLPCPVTRPDSQTSPLRSAENFGSASAFGGPTADCDETTAGGDEDDKAAGGQNFEHFNQDGKINGPDPTVVDRVFLGNSLRSHFRLSGQLDTGGGQAYFPMPATLNTFDQATRVAQFCEDPSDSKQDPHRAQNTVGDSGPEVPPSTKVERRPAEGQKFPRSRAIPANPVILHPSCILDAPDSPHVLQSVCQDACCAELDGRSSGNHPSSGACQFPVEAALGFKSPMLPPSRLACSLSAPPSVGTLGFSPDSFFCGDCLFGFSPVPDPVRSCGAGDPENTALSCPCLDETPDSRLHACLPGTTEGPDRPKDPAISSVGQCIAGSADPAFMLASFCQADPDLKPHRNVLPTSGC